MNKASSQRQQAQQNDVFSLLPDAYHEAGHAVVGQVIGRLIALVSIKQATSYRGCCRFDAYAESTHQHNKWQKGCQNPELLTILYAGTGAVSLLCEQRGWDYEVLRSSDLQDRAEIEQLSGEMFGDDAERTMALETCRKQASESLDNALGCRESAGRSITRLAMADRSGSACHHRPTICATR
jgi:hypothetical protein